MSTIELTKLLGCGLICGSLGLTLALIWLRPAAVSGLCEHAARLDGDLRFLRLAGSGRRLAAWQATAGLGLALWSLALLSPLPLVALALLALAPNRLLERRRRERVTRIEAQLDTWLLALANALRATPSLGDALASTAALIPAPLGEEIDLLLKEYQLGVGMDRALASTAARIGSQSLSAGLLTLRVARSSGGDLSGCLEASAAALREMARLEGVVRTKTAEGKAQAFVISIIPAPLFAMLHWLDPDFLRPLAISATGHAVLVIAATLWIGAVLLAMRIVQVDV